jgi:hypothetical protein
LGSWQHLLGKTQSLADPAGLVTDGIAEEVQGFATDKIHQLLSFTFISEAIDVVIGAFGNAATELVNVDFTMETDHPGGLEFSIIFDGL